MKDYACFGRESGPILCWLTWQYQVITMTDFSKNDKHLAYSDLPWQDLSANSNPYFPRFVSKQFSHQTVQKSWNKQTHVVLGFVHPTIGMNQDVEF